MVDLIDKFKEGGITVNDVCLYSCCGSGTFLLIFMKKQLNIEADDEEKKKIFKKHSLKAVFQIPKELFQPNAGVFTSVVLFQAKTGGQKKTDKVYFYNLVDDGYKRDNKFRKDKNKGNNIQFYTRQKIC